MCNTFVTHFEKPTNNEYNFIPSHAQITWSVLGLNLYMTGPWTRVSSRTNKTRKSQHRKERRWIMTVSASRSSSRSRTLKIQYQKKKRSANNWRSAR
jgi:hypothetical protein